MNPGIRASAFVAVVVTSVASLAICLAGCQANHDLTQHPAAATPTRPPVADLVPSTTPATTPAATTPFHLHLNGIGGYRYVDKSLLRGLQDGGLEGRVLAYDWTGIDVGMGALLDKARHREQSKKVAEMLIAAWREQPGRRITITCHSGGAGICVWALEQLPEEVKIDTIVMLAPALSPGYDLSPALQHVTGKLYAFYSPYDAAVLGFGTRMFGTIDGPKGEASGKIGFRQPANAVDPKQYERLVQIPYDSAWLKLGNAGDHIGWMSRPFAHEVIAPLMLEGKMPTGTTTPNPDVLKIPPLPTSEAVPQGTTPPPIPLPATVPAPATEESGSPAANEP
jgi:hypothetical protein